MKKKTTMIEYNTDDHKQKEAREGWSCISEVRYSKWFCMLCFKDLIFITDYCVVTAAAATLQAFIVFLLLF